MFEYGPWHFWVEVSKCNPQARRMVDRHYTYRPVKSRPMGKEVGPPGQKIILLTPEGKAVWGSHRPAPWAGIIRQDKFEGHTCFIFRNEGSPYLSSDLIKEAVTITIERWGVAPFQTYIAVEKVASVNPGYCFLKAGFEHDKYVTSRKLGKLRRLILPCL